MHRNFAVPFFVCVLALSVHSVFAQTWTNLSTTNNPPERLNHSAVYDPIANRMVIFGGKATIGTNVGVITNDMWSLDLSTLAWQEITPATGLLPPPRFTHNAIFDSAQNRMIVWSGQGLGGVFYNDVWAFSFSSNSWEQLWANGNVSGAPNQRYGTTAQFDPAERRLINVSGFTTEGRFPDTWAFQVDSLLWYDQTHTAASLHPEKRCLHSSCFAEDRRSVFLYGGQTDGIPYLNDLWILSVDTFEWVPHLLNGSPNGRHFTSLVYDGKENLFVFGGITAGSTASNELWKLSLTTNTWEQLQPTGMNPATRYGHTAIYAPSRNSMVVFGGMLQNNYRFNDTWEFHLTSVTTPVEHTGSPERFHLSQNYPNPFNPQTTFEFQIADFGIVTLKIYDMLGREVTTVVDEKLHPGMYTRSWNAAGFPSGVYHYRLQSATHTETRAMILLK